MFQMETQGNVLSNKNGMLILVRIHGFSSIASKPDPKQKRKRSIHSLVPTTQRYRFIWRKARAQTVSQDPEFLSLSSALSHVLAVFSNQPFSHGPQMAAFAPGAMSLQILIHWKGT